KGTALNSLQERLRDSAVADIITHTDVDRYGRLLPPDSPPQKFSQPGSGLYAVILGPDGHRVWKSNSALDSNFGFLQPLQPGDHLFAGPVDTRMGRVYYYAIGVSFDNLDGKSSTPATVMVAQTEQQ
ncbi:hypothetical protein, partial [Staphylococcus aureus]|uniref:hypothetical protein n=1 Tax=Staphylococcus aureus TaxID=1280 RepID=UPI0039BEA2F9